MAKKYRENKTKIGTKIIEELKERVSMNKTREMNEYTEAVSELYGLNKSALKSNIRKTDSLGGIVTGGIDFLVVRWSNRYKSIPLEVTMG